MTPALHTIGPTPGTEFWYKIHSILRMWLWESLGRHEGRNEGRSGTAEGEMWQNFPTNCKPQDSLGSKATTCGFATMPDMSPVSDATSYCHGKMLQKHYRLRILYQPVVFRGWSFDEKLSNCWAARGYNKTTRLHGIDNLLVGLVIWLMKMRAHIEIDKWSCLQSHYLYCHISCQLYLH